MSISAWETSFRAQCNSLQSDSVWLPKSLNESPHWHTPPASLNACRGCAGKIKVFRWWWWTHSVRFSRSSIVKFAISKSNGKAIGSDLAFCIQVHRQILAKKGCKFDDSLSFNDSSLFVPKWTGCSSPVISTKHLLHLPEIDTVSTSNHKQNRRNTGVLRYNKHHLPTRFLLSIGGISYGGA